MSSTKSVDVVAEIGEKFKTEAKEVEKAKNEVKTKDMADLETKKAEDKLEKKLKKVSEKAERLVKEAAKEDPKK